MSRRYLRPGVLVGHLLVLAAALTCLRLGWWQWGVAHQTRGTAQNLGYALLWPVFAGAFIYMWLRFLHLESARDAELAELTDGTPADDGDDPAGAHAAGGDGIPGEGSPGGDGMPGEGSPGGDTMPGEASLGGDGMPGQGAADDADVVAHRAASGAGMTDDTAAGSSEAADEEPAAGESAAAGTATVEDRVPDDRVHDRDRPHRRTRRPPTESYTIAVATVGGDEDEDDPELAAYNRALAALAEQDRRRAR